MIREYMPHSAEAMARSIMNRYGLLDDRWNYDYGVMWRGMEALYALTGDARYLAYIRDAMDAFVGEDGGIRTYTLESYNLDYICNGRQLLYLHALTGERKYKLAADTLRRQLREQPRTPQGGFWHKQCYPQQMWLDGLHMAAPFYAEYALREGDDAGVRDAALQLTLAFEKTFEPRTGLWHHAWDAACAQPWADPKTGRAPHAWGRAVGWYALALADVLALLPREHPCFEPLRRKFETLAARLLEIREDGVWMQVLDEPKRVGNYPESSASCLIVCAILKAARLGLIPANMGEAAQESFWASRETRLASRICR